MEDSTREIPDTIDWMLHSERIDDNTLAEVLCHTYYPPVYSLAMFLVKDPEKAKRLAQQTLCQAILVRHRFWHDRSLQVWLYSLLYQRHSHLNPEKNQLFALYHRLLLVRRGKADQPEKSGLELEFSLPLILYDDFNLTETEIGQVIGISEDEVRSRMFLARRALYLSTRPDLWMAEWHGSYLNFLHQKANGSITVENLASLENHLEGCLACREYAERLPQIEKNRQEELAIEPSLAGLTPDQVSKTIDEVRAAVDRHHKKKERSIPIREFFVVVGLLLLLIYLGRTYRVLEAYDARPTATPYPTFTPYPDPRNPLFGRGIEGQDYFYYKYWIQEGDTLESIAAKANLTVDEVKNLNPQWTNFRVGQSLTLVAFKSFGWFQPLPGKSIILPPMLTANSTVEEVLERYENSHRYWQRLWIRQLTINYGPPGFIGPPETIYITQHWIYQPDHSISAGTRLGYGNFTIFTNGILEIALESGDLTGWFLSDNPWPVSLPVTYISLLKGNVQIVDMDVVADHKAVVLATEEARRVWVDAVTGLPLRYDRYGGPDNDVLLSSTSTVEIVYEPIFPDDLFYPPTSPVKELARNMAGDQSGSVILPEYSIGQRPRLDIPKDHTPPPDFDLSKSQVILQWPVDPQVFEGIEVIVDEYYLGAIDFQKPDILKGCDRSPDGQIITFNTRSQSFQRSSTMYWLRLDPLELHPILNTGGADALPAIAPDSRRLAYWSCQDGCGINILDTESGQTDKIPTSYEWMSYISWSPDGSQLAYITWTMEEGHKVAVMDLASREEIYTGGYDWMEGKLVEPGSPIDTWGIPFPYDPVERGCILP